MRLLPWIGKGAWTLFDQALFAGSNFVLNIILARWLSPEAYGAFAIAFTIFLLVSMVHTGLLTEPMLVFGPGRFKEQWGDYLRLLLRGHWVLTLLIGLLLLVVGWGFEVADMQLMGRVLMVLGVVEPLILFLWLMRRACYVVLKPVWAASGGSVYVVLLLGGTYGLNRMGYLSAEAGLFLMGVTSLVAGLWIWNLLRRAERLPVDAGFTSDVRQEHWKYGRWATTTGALQWVPGQLAYLILPVAIGLEAGGALKALLNFIMPAAHIYGSLAVLLVPIFVRVRKSNHFHQVFGGSLLTVSVGTGLYWAMLGWWGEPLMVLLYDGQYTEYAHLLWLVGSLPVMAGLGSVLRTVLRALERPDQVFWAYLGSSIVASTLGVYLIFSFGLEGALFSFIAQMVVELSVMFYFFFRDESRAPAVVLRPEGITE